MSKKLELEGQRFGLLTVLKMIPRQRGNKKSYSRCECLCDCGNVVIKDVYRMMHSKIKPSCGCYRAKQMSEKLSKDIIGQKFGRLLVLETIWNDGKRPDVKCLCDCGNVVILNRNSVMSGGTKSCGCLQREMASKARQKDDSGFVSDFGIRIIKPYKKNEIGQMIWECKCGFCDDTFYALPAFVKNNHVRSCGCLISSSMETFIKDFLDRNKVIYQRQYTFNDCINENGRKLKFDFALFKDGEVFYLIEYDGEQHYKSVEYFGGDDGFEKRQKYDFIKNDFCKNNSIPLLRLPYYLSNEEIKEEIINILNA